MNKDIEINCLSLSPISENHGVSRERRLKQFFSSLMQ